MRRTLLTVILFSTLSLAAAFRPADIFSLRINSLSNAHSRQMQNPMNPGPVQGSSPDEESPGGSNAGGGDGGATLSISDILPQTRKINIFASLTRDISSVTTRLESTNPASNTTLLAPLNSAMQALPRKPWEDRPGEESSGVGAERNEDRAAGNLQRFVEMHVVPVSPWLEGRANRIETMGGQELWWEERDGARVVMPGDLVVEGVVGRVGNGEVWAVRGVVNYQ